MKKIRLVKGFTLIAALMAVAFVFGCSSSSSTSPKDVSTTESTTFAAGSVAGVTATTSTGSTATAAVAEGTKAYVGDTEVTGDLTIEITANDYDSEATFPDGSFDNVNVEGSIGTVTTEGFVIVKAYETATGNLVTNFDPPVIVSFSLKDAALATRVLDAVTPAKAHAAMNCKIYKKSESSDFWAAVLDCISSNLFIGTDCVFEILGNSVSISSKNPNGAYGKLCMVTGS